jgi:hypothetical protein
LKVCIIAVLYVNTVDINIVGVMKSKVIDECTGLFEQKEHVTKKQRTGNTIFLQ